MKDEEEPGTYWLNKEKGSWTERIKNWFYRKVLTDSFLEDLKTIAWDLAKVFDYNTLAQSSETSLFKKKSNEVHAWIFLNYPKIYRRLIFDNRVVDLACLYSKRNFESIIINKIKLEDLEQYEGSIMYCKKKTLKNYPKFTFNKIYILHRKGKTFYDEVAMETNCTIKVNNWETTGTRLRFDASLLCFIAKDLPLIIITKNPMKPNIFFDEPFEDEQGLIAKKVEVLTKLYHNAQTEIAMNDKNLDMAEKIAVRNAKMASDAIKEADRQKREDWRSILRKRELEDKRQEIELNNLKTKRKYNLTPIIVTLIIVIGILIGIFLYFNFIQSQAQQQIIEGASLGIKSLNLNLMRCI